jgi:hypothetical protein
MMIFQIIIIVLITVPVIPLVQRIAIPQYMDPDNISKCQQQPTSLKCPWHRSIAMSSVAILVGGFDVDDAPADITAYKAVITEAHQAGKQLLGYVYTQSGRRNISVVEADVMKYFTLYNDVANQVCRI